MIFRDDTNTKATVDNYLKEDLYARRSIFFVKKKSFRFAIFCNILATTSDQQTIELTSKTI